MGKLLSKSSKEAAAHSKIYQKYMSSATDLKLYSAPPENVTLNPNFPKLKKWALAYLGPATAEFHALDKQDSNLHRAIRDENRNAIIPGRSITIENRIYYLSVKGCGAFEDMYFKNILSHESIIGACRDPSLFSRIRSLKSTHGFIMAETWMGESPYGAQGEDNGKDELRFSCSADPLAIKGAYICPVIALVQLPKKIESTARKFYWFRTYPKSFYQSIRLVPSRARLYFESDQTANDPEQLLEIFGVNESNEIDQFESNFIRSGIALLSLFSRSAIISGEKIKGLVYVDVWMDKDAIIAPDGVIHFADLEGLDYKTVPKSKYASLQRGEWDKLAFEFMYALVNIDSYRRKREGITGNWRHQRDDLAMRVQDALEGDPYAYIKLDQGCLSIILDLPPLPRVEIPFLEGLSV